MSAAKIIARVFFNGAGRFYSPFIIWLFKNLRKTRTWKHIEVQQFLYCLLSLWFVQKPFLDQIYEGIKEKLIMIVSDVPTYSNSTWCQSCTPPKGALFWVCLQCNRMHRWLLIVVFALISGPCGLARKKWFSGIYPLVRNLLTHRCVYIHVHIDVFMLHGVLKTGGRVTIISINNYNWNHD